MTYEYARRIACKLGFSLRRTGEGRELSVAINGEPAIYFTDSLDDAIATMREAARTGSLPSSRRSNSVLAWDYSSVRLPLSGVPRVTDR